MNNYVLLLFLFTIFSQKNYSQAVGECKSSKCNQANISWIADNSISKCIFTHSQVTQSKISKVEYGNITSPNESGYHCYYVETKVCNTDDCDKCTLKKVYEFMISEKKYIAPTKEIGPAINCGASSVDIKFVNIPLQDFNPIVTTVNPTKYSIINYTAKVYLKNGTTRSHLLHPGKVQRTVFQRGKDIYIGTLGEGNGMLGSANNYLAEGLWCDIDKHLVSDFNCSKSDNPTLILFDVSGSMNDNNKWQSAKQSALSTLSSIKSQSKAANLKPSISIRAFDGECIADPTKEVIGFSTDLAAVENAINTKIPPPDGGTPLPQSIQVSEDKLRAYLTANNIKKGKLIILTDGESSCGSLRPQGVYGAGQQGYQPLAKFNAGSPTALIKYYAIGFDIAPGSEAERDLQYLVQTNGGKYLNAQNQAELTEAFYKFNRVYIPKPAPALTPTNEKDQLLFTDGLTFIEDEEYDKALENYRTYIKANDKDYNGIYNFALMSEANERYKAAIKNYELYLQLNPNAADKSFVLETILKLKETAKRYAAYNKLVVKSDMEYLNLYFQKIQDGESVALAIEFIGFLKEKYTYYRDLAAIVEVDDRLFKTNANEVFKGLKECVETIGRNPQAWDRDATPVLSRTYLNMERLLNSF